MKQLVTLFAVLLITFFMIKLLPGSPFSDEGGMGKVAQSVLEKQYGTDQPYLIQFFSYLKSLLHGDLGKSLIYRDRPVLEMFINAFPVTATLTALTLLIATTCGIALGLASAPLFRLPFLFALSVPSFFLAAAQREWLPHTNSLLLPAIALALGPTATIARLTRDRLSSVMKEPYIQAAEMKGLSKSRILLFHALPIALTPSITYITQAAAHLMMGSFAIEKLFALHGIGLITTAAVLNRDTPVVLAAGLFYTIALTLFVYLSDTLYGILDPRLNSSSNEERPLLNPF